MEHFRRDHLLASGAWDAWNVTEDADLGVRLARRGLRVRTFDSDTGEEAPVTARSLFDQRVRWKKGWMQTLIVHLREPGSTLRDLGPRRFAGVVSLFCAGLLGPLFWPIFVGALLWSAMGGDLLRPESAFDAVRSTAVCFLVYLGAVAMLLPLVIGAIRQNLTRDLWVLPLLPVWHLGLCAAAWAALVELAREPHRWAKTEHGQARRRVPIRGEAVVKAGISVKRERASMPQ